MNDEGHFVSDKLGKIDYSKLADEFTISCIKKMCQVTGALFVADNLWSTLYGIAICTDVEFIEGDFNSQVDVLRQKILS